MGVENWGLKLPNRNIDLSDQQKEILHLVTDEFLTLKQIAQRRKTSLQAVYKIIKKLKEKGAFDGGLNRVEKVESTFNPSDLRLHGQEFNIRILYQDNRYQQQLMKSNLEFMDGNSLRLYKNSIEIYSGQSFFGKDINETEKRSLDYWRRFLARLEHDWKITLLKPRARNIKIVNQHWARGNSEISDNAVKEKVRVWVYAEEDGKLCFITDDSFGFREDETLHPITAKPDRKAIDKQINDWRINNPPTSSELATHIGNLVLGFDNYGKHIRSHIGVLNKIEEGQKLLNHSVKRLSKVIKGVLVENQSLKLENKGQKTLGEFR